MYGQRRKGRAPGVVDVWPRGQIVSNPVPFRCRRVRPFTLIALSSLQVLFEFMLRKVALKYEETTEAGGSAEEFHIRGDHVLYFSAGDLPQLQGWVSRASLVVTDLPISGRSPSEASLSNAQQEPTTASATAERR